MLQAEQVLQKRYQLQQQLGQNAGRQTWLTKDVGKSPAQPVIVKLLAFNPQLHWDELKLFEREAQVLNHLNHPQIPQYRDYFSVDEQIGEGLPWFGLVQEYIPGDSLEQLLAQGKHFTQEEVQKIATGVLEILIYLHELSPPLFHRDIKPSNLILGKDGQIYLVDFGAVQDRATAEGVTFTVVGTSGYAPPEQLWGQAVPASDLYALGATLIHLLTGTAPADLPLRQMRIQFADRVRLNPRFSNWLGQLTEPAAERRFSSARQALEALQVIREPSSFNTKAGQSASCSVRYGRLASLMLLQVSLIGVGCLVIWEYFLNSSTVQQPTKANQWIQR
jgi:serine/threonine protein kinase